ncbi:hypothetical protein HAX54_048399 [Datura stramonium]|uniref:Disease resistance protein At4g27190-like leucine-rich repeats domain-containing protein n=1 Tax=Datura stramonium TaxID=4076 RepID=A0ABS8WN31_DATST|nr:hypothetical protein [Datura stramonium]
MQRATWFSIRFVISSKLISNTTYEYTTSRREEEVKMHDLLREMALRITNVKPRYMVRARIESQVPEEQVWVFDLDKVSFIFSYLKGIPDDMAPNCSILSTLLLSSCSLRRIPESFFQYMNNLQVLYFSFNRKLMDFSSCMSNLGSVRVLSLGECKELRFIPPLGKLKNLRVLDVSGTSIKELQYLKLPLCMNARAEDLASLELLEEFRDGFHDLHNFNKFMRKIDGLSFKIERCDDIEWIVKRNTTIDPHCICFHSLIVSCFRNLDLKNLEKLEVRWCNEMEEIVATEEEGSSQRRNLQQHLITSTSSDILILPKLKEFYLEDLPKLKRICEGKLICDSLESITFLPQYEEVAYLYSHCKWTSFSSP